MGEGGGRPRPGWLTGSAEGIAIRVRASPGARREGIEGVDARGELRVRVTSPPEGGRANDAIERLLAERLGVKRSGVRVVRGHTSRSKVVFVSGAVTAERAAELLGTTDMVR